MKTLQECKDIIAKKYSIDNFQLTVWMTDEAAELYASQFKSRIAELEKDPRDSGLDDSWVHDVDMGVR